MAFNRWPGYVLERTLRDFWADGEDFLIFGKRLERAGPGTPADG